MSATKEQLSYSLGFLAAKEGKPNVPAMCTEWQILICSLMEFSESIPVSDAFSEGYLSGKDNLKKMKALRIRSEVFHEARRRAFAFATKL